MTRLPLVLFHGWYWILLLGVAGGFLPRPAIAAENDPISTEAKLAASAIRVPEGFHVEAVASEPLFANPVAFCFDPAGRIFVAETYRVKKGVEDNREHMDWLDDDLAARTVADRRAYTQRRMGDKIDLFTAHSEQVRLIEDPNGDGRYDRSSVFSDGYNAVEDGAAAGVLSIGDRIWFTCIPALWELRDADGDGQAEEKRAIATGFGVHNAFYGHDLHGLTFGPDGKIYFSIGDRGLHVETPAGTLENPDSGAVLRCNPDGTELELFATGLRNPQELAFNELGDLFTGDNNSDSGDRARLVYVVEGMDAGWRMFYQYLPDRGPFNREKVWHPQNDEQPARIVPPIANLGDGPSGLVHYPGTGLPAEYDGAFFLCDFRGTAGGSLIRNIWFQPHGASYHLAKDKVFASNVLATDCDFGPDGNFFILDWVDGWAGTGTGRIHRVTSDDASAQQASQEMRESMAQIDDATSDKLALLLGHANARVRLAAQQKLVAHQAAKPLSQVAKSTDAAILARLHAIWGLGQLAEADPQLFTDLLALCSDADPEARAQSAKTLGRAAKTDESLRRDIANQLIPLLADDSPRVRAFAAISLGKLQTSEALDALLAMADDNADRDPVLRHAAAMGLAGSQSTDALVAAADGRSLAERLAIVLALGRQKSPLVAKFLHDSEPRIVLEAARFIWDTPISAAFADLAELIDDVPMSDPLARRVLAANLAQRTDHHLAATIRFALDGKADRAMREHAWELIRQWAEPSSRDVVEGSWRPLPHRSQPEVAAVVRSLLPQVLASPADSRSLGIVVAMELGVQEAGSELVQLIGDNSTPGSARVRALQALLMAEKQALSTGIERGLQASDAEVRSAARELLTKHFPERAIEELQRGLASNDMREQQAAITALGNLDQPAAHAVLIKWMKQLAEGTCPTPLQLDVLEAARQSKDPMLTGIVKQFDSRTPVDSPLGRYILCTEGGDAPRGERIFRENTAISCRRCHSVKPGELLVGPNLADVGAKRSRAELLESIVSPNAKITEGFQTTVMQLDTGKVVSGIVRREDDEHAVLVDPDNKEIAVNLAEVEDRFEGKSAMPEDVMKHIAPRDLRDLIEYLSTLRAAQ